MVKKKKTDSAPDAAETATDENGEQLATIQAGPETITGAPGDIAVRNSWFINPQNVRHCTQTDRDTYMVETMNGNYELTPEEAAPFLQE